MMALSCTFGVFAAVGGLYASYELHASPGATMVLLATLVFFCALAIAGTRRRLLSAMLRPPRAS
jgi:iron/zinc/copper transport system permease protein